MEDLLNLPWLSIIVLSPLVAAMLMTTAFAVAETPRSRLCVDEHAMTCLSCFLTLMVMISTPTDSSHTNM